MNQIEKVKAMRITGKTYEWKKQLKEAGLKWNAMLKCWEGELANNFAASMVRNGLESGELREMSGHDQAVAALQGEGGY